MEVNERREETKILIIFSLFLVAFCVFSLAFLSINIKAYDFYTKNKKVLNDIISDDPNFESLVEKLEYRKMNFSTKDLNTKESKDLKKANRTQIICGVAFLIEVLLFAFVSTFLLENYFEHGLNLFDYVIFIILILPFVIISVNADHKARTLKGIVAEQNYRRIYN